MTPEFPSQSKRIKLHEVPHESCIIIEWKFGSRFVELPQVKPLSRVILSRQKVYTRCDLCATRYLSDKTASKSHVGWPENL